MKKFLSGILISLLVLILATAAGVVDITSVTSPTSNPGTTASVDVIVTNTGDADINTVILTSTKLTSSSGVDLSATAPTISSITNLVVNTPQTQTFTVDIGSVYAGAYLGTVTATDASDATVTDTFDYSVTVNSLADLAISGLTDNLFLMSAPMDNSKSESFTIQNNGSLDLSTSVKLSGDFTDPGDKTITFKVNTNTATLDSAVSIGTIIPGSTSEVSVEATVPDNMDLDTYEGTVTITTTQGTTDTFDFNVRVEPDLCKDGRVSNGVSVDGPNKGNLRVDINEPDNNDNFKINDEIEIKVEVENHGSSDLDVIVEASLWNLNQNEEIESVESDVVDINDDDSNDFTLNLLVPLDEDLLEDENDEYRMYIRAYEDGEEEENCNYDSVDMELDRDKHAVIVDSFTVSPSTVSCGSTVNFIAGVTNIGKEDEDDVEIRITAPVDPELNLNLVSLPFKLDKFGDSGDDASEAFSFKVPQGIPEKGYRIIAQAFFNNGRDESDQEGSVLTVTNCAPEVATVSLTLPQTTFSANVGMVFGVPATLLNTGTSAATFTVEVMPVGAWADTITQDITVNAGQSSTVYSYLTPKEGTIDGTYTATINVKSGSSLLATNTVTVTIGVAVVAPSVTGEAVYQPTVTPASIWRDITSNTPVLIVLIVVVLAVIVYLVSLLMKPKQL